MKNNISERIKGSRVPRDRNRNLTRFSVVSGLRTAGDSRPYRLTWFIGLLTFSLFANTPPEITNVRASQRENTKLVDIYYDAADADGDLLKVRIEISDNDGLKYSVPAFSLTGDIGEGIAAGTNKHIVWDAGMDWDGEYSDKMRVKVYAIDAQGFPGLEWGNEVPPGGFLMGQDGGAEGSGPSRHVNIPWSYWLSKYEITCQQYCDFLNAALASGFVARNGTTEVDSVPGVLPGMNSAWKIIKLGDNQRVRWNVNNFEVVGSNTNKPITVSWVGALAFCCYYGYDLPTEAEWEKAARGPNNDDQDEHLIYPWGNEITGSCANYLASGDPYDNGTSPVGYYNGNQTPVGGDMINLYGLYDVIGNVSEWTRSIYDESKYQIETYPNIENLDEIRNRTICGTYVTKGGNFSDGCLYDNNLKIYYRRGMYFDSLSQVSTYANNDNVGFRPIRRSTNDIFRAKCCGVLNCESLNAGVVTEIVSDFGTFTITGGVVKCVAESAESITNRYLSTIANSDFRGQSAYVSLNLNRGRLRYVRFRMFATADADYASVKLVSVLPDGSEVSTCASGDLNVWCTRSLVAHGEAVHCYLVLYSRDNYSYSISLDDIEFYTTEN